MKHNTLKSLSAVVLVLCMVLSMCGAAFAETITSTEDASRRNPDAQPNTIISTTSSFERDSSKKGTAYLSATSSNPSTPYIISKITLQEAPLNSKKYVDSNVATDVEKSYSCSILHVVSFPVTTKKEYRVKFEVTDCTRGVESTLTFYEYLK